MRLSRSFAAVLGVALACAAPASAASPTMSTAPGSSGACGSPHEICSPAGDVFAGGSPGLPQISAALGLVAGDVLTGLSYGLDALTGSAQIAFSVDPASSGAAGAAPDVSSESSVLEAYADIFDAGTVSAPAPNTLSVDGDGTIASPAGPFAGIGLVEAPSAGLLDDLSALSTCDPAAALGGGGGAFLSLAAGSPTLAALGAGPADLLQSSSGIVTVAASAASMGLVAGDEIDALAAAGFVVAFSLAPGSPTLTTISAGPADIIREGSPPFVIVPAAAMGLNPSDNIDALDVAADLDGDLVNDSCDNCSLVANNDQANADGDASGDACDTCTDLDGDGFGDPAFPGNTCPDDNCPTVANPGQADTDGDGDGDLCDACTNNGGVQDFVVKPKISLKKINTDVVSGNDQLQVKGAFALAGSTNFANLDPGADGLRIVMRGVGGGLSFDTVLAGGAFGGKGTAGWQLNGSGKTWKYQDKTGAPQNGILKVQIKDLASKSANRVQITIKGKGGDYPLNSGDEPPDLTVVLGGAASAAAGECTESVFTVVDCKYSTKGDRLTCKQ